MKQPIRQRRRPEVAEAEILDAAEQLLRERPFRDFQVDAVMERTGLARPSFYQYFRDRHGLIIRLLEQFSAELLQANNHWFQGTNDPVEDLRAAYDGVAAFWALHGPVLRAIADAPVYDHEVEEAYRKFMDAIIQGGAKRIRSEIEKKRVKSLDPDGTAAALIWMRERYLNVKLGRQPQESPQTIAETLFTLWVRALYGPS